MKNFLRDIYLFLSVFCVYSLVRIAILNIFPSSDAVISWKWVALSLRFDMLTSAYFLLPTAILTIIGLFLKRDFCIAKKIYATFAISISVIIAIINICFFSEYNAQFNHWIFGIFVDDFSAIIGTILQDYPVFSILVGIIVFVFIISKITKFVFQKTDRFNRKFPIIVSAIISVAYVATLVLAMRGGSFHGRPLQLRDTAITPSAYLNNLVPTSAYCIKTEVTKFIGSSSLGGLKHFGLKERDIAYVAKKLFQTDEKHLDKILTYKASGAKLAKRPSRIFVIIGEGNSAWPLNYDLLNYNILPMQKQLCKNTLYCKKALPSGRGTMASVSSIVCGIPSTEITVNGVLKQSTDFAFAKYMKDLGYTSTFWYAGQSTWLQLGDFVKFNKFDNIIGGENMGPAYGSVEWGLRDKDMFEFIANANIPENSFNMILTVSNHPPFDVDLQKEGCNADIKTELDKKIWHHWYADKCISNFIKVMSQKYPDAIFVITGDHPSREHPDNLKSDPLALFTVPIIFVGELINPLKKEIKSMTHLDIMPTLIDMIAPKGFEYKTWGCSIFSETRKLPPMNVGAVAIDGKIIPIETTQCPKEIQDIHNMYMALAYWRSISDGNISKTEKNKK